MTLCKQFLDDMFQKYLQPAILLGENQVKKWSIGSASNVTNKPFPVLHEFFGMLHTAVEIVLKTCSYLSSTVVSRVSSTTTLKHFATMSSSRGGNLAVSPELYDEVKGDGDDDAPLHQFLHKMEALMSRSLSSCVNCLFCTTICFFHIFIFFFLCIHF